VDRHALEQVRKEGYQLDVIDRSIADPAGITVSIDMRIKFGGNGSRGEFVVENTYGSERKRGKEETDLTGFEPL